MSPLGYSLEFLVRTLAPAGTFTLPRHFRSGTRAPIDLKHQQFLSVSVSIPHTFRVLFQRQLTRLSDLMKASLFPIVIGEDKTPGLEFVIREAFRFSINGTSLRVNVLEDVSFAGRVIEPGDFVAHPVADVHLNPQFTGSYPVCILMK